MSEVLIEIDGFSFAFGDRNVLDHISLNIRQGEYLSIIGPNGAGKSTLLRCLMRILRGGEGRIAISGRPLESFRQKELARLVSYVPQGDSGAVPFTVEEFVLLGRYPYLSPFTTFTGEDRSQARAALALTGSEHLGQRRLHTLSGGERQTVSVAAAIAQGGKIMLLDEPTTFLDPRHESEILGILRRVNRSCGITLVSVTHDINDAVLQSDRIVSLKQGRVMYDGPSGGIMNNTVLERIYEKKFSFVRHPVTGGLIILPEVGPT